MWHRWDFKDWLNIFLPDGRRQTFSFKIALMFILILHSLSIRSSLPSSLSLPPSPSVPSHTFLSSFHLFRTDSLVFHSELLHDADVFDWLSGSHSGWHCQIICQIIFHFADWTQVRTLRKDYARFERGPSGDEEGDTEQSGWKQVSTSLSLTLFLSLFSIGVCVCVCVHPIDLFHRFMVMSSGVQNIWKSFPLYWAWGINSFSLLFFSLLFPSGERFMLKRTCNQERKMILTNLDDLLH